jgi:hypothetical protein
VTCATESKKDMALRSEMAAVLEGTGLDRLNLDYEAGADQYHSSEAEAQAVRRSLLQDRLTSDAKGTWFGCALFVVDVDHHWSEFRRDFNERIPHRLLGKEPDLYASYDRYTSEAQFRAAISAPLVAILIVLAVRWSPLWLVGLFAIVELLRRAWESVWQSVYMLMQVVLTERVPFPARQVITECDSPLRLRDCGEVRLRLEANGMSGRELDEYLHDVRKAAQSDSSL